MATTVVCLTNTVGTIGTRETTLLHLTHAQVGLNTCYMSTPFRGLPGTYSIKCVIY